MTDPNRELERARELERLIDQDGDGPMVVATESYDADDPYTGSFHITAGVTRIRAAHEIVRARPSAFAPLPNGPAGPATRSVVRITTAPVELIRSSTSSPGSWAPSVEATPMASGSSRVELWEFPVSSLVVRLTPLARSQLRTHTMQFSDGRETGGALIALGGSDLTITGVTTPSDHDERAAYSFTHDFEREQSFLTAGERIAGSYHTHPISADGRPSVQDLTSWANLREDHHADRFVGIVVTPNRSIDLVVGRAMEWSDPQIHAWVVHEVGGRIVAERAEKIEEGWTWE